MSKQPPASSAALIVRVPDLAEAESWYRAAFATEPYLNEVFAVGFYIDGTKLILLPKEEETSIQPSRAAFWWPVPDTKHALERLVKLGAMEIQLASGEDPSRVALVKDRWGNEIRIIERPTTRERPHAPEVTLPWLGWKVNRRAALAALAGLLCNLPLFVFALVIGTYAHTKAVNVAVLVLGAAVGWLLGVVVSPYDTEEEKRFATYVGAVTVFASGALAAQLLPLVGGVFSIEFFRAMDALTGFRIAASFTAMLAALLYVHAVRSYESRP